MGGLLTQSSPRNVLGFVEQTPTYSEASKLRQIIA